MEFRYAVATDDAAVRELGMKTAAALTTPLLGILSAPQAGRELPDRGNFCSVDRPDVEVVALAASRRGHDLVVRLQSFAPETAEVSVSFPQLPVGNAWIGTHLKRELREAEVGGDEVSLAVPAGSCVYLTVDLRDESGDT